MGIIDSLIGVAPYNQPGSKPTPPQKVPNTKPMPPSDQEINHSGNAIQQNIPRKTPMPTPPPPDPPPLTLPPQSIPNTKPMPPSNQGRTTIYDNQKNRSNNAIQQNTPTVIPAPIPPPPYHSPLILHPQSVPNTKPMPPSNQGYDNQKTNSNNAIQQNPPTMTPAPTPPLPHDSPLILPPQSVPSTKPMPPSNQGRTTIYDNQNNHSNNAIQQNPPTKTLSPAPPPPNPTPSTISNTVAKETPTLPAGNKGETNTSDNQPKHSHTTLQITATTIYLPVPTPAYPTAPTNPSMVHDPNHNSQPSKQRETVNGESKCCGDCCCDCCDCCRDCCTIL